MLDKEETTESEVTSAPVMDSLIMAHDAEIEAEVSVLSDRFLGRVIAQDFEIGYHFGGRRSSRRTAPITLSRLGTPLELRFYAHDNIGSHWKAEVAAQANGQIITPFADVKRRGSIIRLEAGHHVTTSLVELVTRHKNGNDGADEVFVSRGTVFYRLA